MAASGLHRKMMAVWSSCLPCTGITSDRSGTKSSLTLSHLTQKRIKVAVNSINGPLDLRQFSLVSSCQLVESVEGINRSAGIVERIQSIDEFFFVVVHGRRIGVKYRGDCLLDHLLVLLPPRPESWLNWSSPPLRLLAVAAMQSTGLVVTRRSCGPFVLFDAEGHPWDAKRRASILAVLRRYPVLVLQFGTEPVRAIIAMTTSCT